MTEGLVKQVKDLTDEDKEFYEWIECTTVEQRARGEDWVIRGISKGEQITIWPSTKSGINA